MPHKEKKAKQVVGPHRPIINPNIEKYTTRPDAMGGATFLCIGEKPRNTRLCPNFQISEGAPPKKVLVCAQTCIAKLIRQAGGSRRILKGTG